MQEQKNLTEFHDFHREFPVKNYMTNLANHHALLNSQCNAEEDCYLLPD